jgi:hypothetical protein
MSEIIKFAKPGSVDNVLQNCQQAIAEHEFDHAIVVMLDKDGNMFIANTPFQSNFMAVGLIEYVKDHFMYEAGEDDE